MSLDQIGFYTLSDERARTATHETPLQRCELILTDRCNFRCPYCRGLREELRGDLRHTQATETLDLWLAEGLRNVRFSGGEPMLRGFTLPVLVAQAKRGGVEHIAVSTNGSFPFYDYRRLVELGVNDFSISLDGGCCAVGDAMSGVPGSWDTVVDNVRRLSEITYVSVGMVFDERNVYQAVEAVKLAADLGVSDIRVIPSAQYNQALTNLAEELDQSFVDRFPILSYRIMAIVDERPVRGLAPESARRCRLVLDDMAVAQNRHFPCIIYMREGGDPIGLVGPNMREERRRWSEQHNTYTDPICRRMCLDVCVEYNDAACEAAGVIDEEQQWSMVGRPF